MAFLLQALVGLISSYFGVVLGLSTHRRTQQWNAKKEAYDELVSILAELADLSNRHFVSMISEEYTFTKDNEKCFNEAALKLYKIRLTVGWLMSSEIAQIVNAPEPDRFEEHPTKLRGPEKYPATHAAEVAGYYKDMLDSVIPAGHVDLGYKRSRKKEAVITWLRENFSVCW